jgi:hypothetical protein
LLDQLYGDGNKKGEESIGIADEKEKWGPLWNEENEKFEKYLRDSSSLSSLLGLYMGQAARLGHPPSRYAR